MLPFWIEAVYLDPSDCLSVLPVYSIATALAMFYKCCNTNVTTLFLCIDF